MPPRRPRHDRRILDDRSTIIYRYVFVLFVVFAFVQVGQQIRSMRPEVQKAEKKAERNRHESMYKENVYNLKSQTPDALQVLEAREVIRRVIKIHPDYYKFDVYVNSKIGKPYRDKFVINIKEDVVKITANTGIAALRGVYTYIKNICYGHVSWEGRQVTLPKEFSNGYGEFISTEKYIYFGNLHTWSLSYSWWKLEEWTAHIDLLAMNGVNLILAPMHEFITFKMYKKLGLTDDEIFEHFSGPGFFSWQRMGKINKWGGPVSFEYLKEMHELQKDIIYQMRKLGGLVAVPAFSGYVPRGLKRIFPKVPIYRVPRWNKIRSNYSNTYFIEPKAPLYREIYELYMKEVVLHLGSDHIYFSEPISALKNRNEIYYKDIFTAQYNIMKQYDPSAVWLVHSTVFTEDDLFWTTRRINSFLRSVPVGRMLIVDVRADYDPMYPRTDAFGEHAFIWCMQHNIGGTLGLYGTPKAMYDGIDDVRLLGDDIALLGLGAAPEGINQNYVMYELLFDFAWDDELTYTYYKWVERYVINRYGIEHEDITSSWKCLMGDVYYYLENQPLDGKYTYSVRPRAHKYISHYYNASAILAVWGNFLYVSRHVDINDLYLYDLVDLSRQGLSDIADQLYIVIMDAFDRKDRAVLRKYRKIFIELLYDIDKILSTNSRFLLERWLLSARSFGKDEEEKDLFEYNARTQITIWDPDGNNVDYANRQWAGLVTDLFIPRWQLFFDKLESSLYYDVYYNEVLAHKEMLEKIEIPFTKRTNRFSKKVQGDTLTISRQVFGRWANYSLELPEVPMRNIYHERDILCQIQE